MRRMSSRPRSLRSRRTPRRCSTGPSTTRRVNRRFLERIDEQVERLNQLILDMLSLARLDSAQELFEHGPLSLVPVLESCLEVQRGRAEAKNLSLTFDPGNLDGETLVVADEEAIRQIFDNLIDNAIKYTGRGRQSPRLLLGRGRSCERRSPRYRHRHSPRRAAPDLRAILPGG